MPEHDRGRPAGAASNVTSSKDSVADQLRRRREASRRLPPLADGRRDPLDITPGDGRANHVTPSRVKPASITLDSDRPFILVRGHVRDLLMAEGLWPIWSAAGRGFVLDAHHLADVLAILEHAGFLVRISERGAA